jgi:hypothetical protein
VVLQVVCHIGHTTCFATAGLEKVQNRGALQAGWVALDVAAELAAAL